MAKVFLDDGTVIVATLNMNTFESDTEVDPEVFNDNISDVSYEENGEVVELGECTLVYGGLQGGKWQFCLNPITEDERMKIALAKNTADIDYIMIMEDL